MSVISEYEAAILTAMSPELLRWFTGHAPKSGIDRKLKVEKKVEDTCFFDREEVLSFDKWLKEPWPRKTGTRPHIPVGIRREIKDEASGTCVMCHGHANTCEAAHIDPVAVTKNNHPENLIWLCANHHTKYDGGYFGPNPEDKEFILSFKMVLRHYRVTLWRTQHKASDKLFSLLDSCDHLLKQLSVAQTETQVKVVKTTARKRISELRALDPVPKSDPRYSAYTTIANEVGSLGSGAIDQQLKKASKARADYVAALGYVKCPLCDASGRYDGTDCPVCFGDREIPKESARNVDVNAYKYVDCPVCDGKGSIDGETCPACYGNARMYQRYADQLDLRDYEKIDCLLCKGDGRYNNEICPVCHGNSVVYRNYLETVDLGEFKSVKCPLCRGSGEYDEVDCPECRGHGSMERRFAEQVDLGDYKGVDCPVCKGVGEFRGNDCPACGGAARMTRRDRDRIDTADFDLVKCPVCKGRGIVEDNDCSACAGDGNMERRHTYNY